MKSALLWTRMRDWNIRTGRYVIKYLKAIAVLDINDQTADQGSYGALYGTVHCAGGGAHSIWSAGGGGMRELVKNLPFLTVFCH